MTELSDRFIPERYTRDESVTVTVAGRAHSIPERLFGRTQKLAEAYELHLLPTIDLYARTQLTKEQCRTLGEELAFIRSVVADTLLESHLDRLLELAGQCVNSPFASELVIEGP
jgi:hypothetical protein